MLKTFAPRRAAALGAVAALVIGLAVPVQAKDKVDSNTMSVDSNMAAAEGGSANARAQRQKKYCIMAETTGKRVRTKICKSLADWKAEGQEINLK